jgi:hypothetical protein
VRVEEGEEGKEKGGRKESRGGKIWTRKYVSVNDNNQFRNVSEREID